MKKRIFIGSSKEELTIANTIKLHLEKNFDVVIWNDDIWDRATFKFNQNFLQSLNNSVLEFDYGVLLGTPDDNTVSRGKEYLTARDNILFEYGLFAGRLGIEKCFLFIEESVKIPSDLQGHYLIVYNKDNLHSKCEKLSETILNDKKLSINFFPSVTLANVYFENFINPVTEKIISDKGLQIDENFYSINDIIFEINIPEEIYKNLNQQAEVFKSKNNLKEVNILVTGRHRGITVDVEKLSSGQLKIIDLPTILKGLIFILEDLLPEEAKILSDKYKMILRREVLKFVQTLEILISKNGYYNVKINSNI